MTGTEQKFSDHIAKSLRTKAKPDIHSRLSTLEYELMASTNYLKKHAGLVRETREYIFDLHRKIGAYELAKTQLMKFLHELEAKEK